MDEDELFELFELACDLEQNEPRRAIAALVLLTAHDAERTSEDAWHRQLEQQVMLARLLLQHTTSTERAIGILLTARDRMIDRLTICQGQITGLAADPSRWFHLMSTLYALFFSQSDALACALRSPSAGQPRRKPVIFNSTRPDKGRRKDSELSYEHLFNEALLMLDFSTSQPWSPSMSAGNTDDGADENEQGCGGDESDSAAAASMRLQWAVYWQAAYLTKEAIRQLKIANGRSNSPLPRAERRGDDADDDDDDQGIKHRSEGASQNDKAALRALLLFDQAEQRLSQLLCQAVTSRSSAVSRRTTEECWVIAALNCIHIRLAQHTIGASKQVEQRLQRLRAALTTGREADPSTASSDGIRCTAYTPSQEIKNFVCYAGAVLLARRGSALRAAQQAARLRDLPDTVSSSELRWPLVQRCWRALAMMLVGQLSPAIDSMTNGIDLLSNAKQMLVQLLRHPSSSDLSTTNSCRDDDAAERSAAPARLTDHQLPMEVVADRALSTLLIRLIRLVLHSLIRLSLACSRPNEAVDIFCEYLQWLSADESEAATMQSSTSPPPTRTEEPEYSVTEKHTSRSVLGEARYQRLTAAGMTAAACGQRHSSTKYFHEAFQQADEHEQVEAFCMWLCSLVLARKTATARTIFEAYSNEVLYHDDEDNGGDDDDNQTIALPLQMILKAWFEASCKDDGDQSAVARLKECLRLVYDGDTSHKLLTAYVLNALSSIERSSSQQQAALDQAADSFFAATNGSKLPPPALPSDAVPTFLLCPADLEALLQSH